MWRADKDTASAGSGVCTQVSRAMVSFGDGGSGSGTTHMCTAFIGAFGKSRKGRCETSTRSVHR
jgi:hypothetical protein